MTYKTEDGEAIEGASPQDIVTALRNGSRFASGESLTDFMEGFADRYWEWNQSTIRADTPENFVADLVKAGYLTALE